MSRWLSVLLALAALVLGVRRGWHRVEAGKTLLIVERRSIELVQRGQANPAELLANARALQQAESWDPANVTVVMSRGSQFLLLGRPESAIEIYRRALALEPRPEIYLNLGRAYWLLGRKGRARGFFKQATDLDPQLERMLPAGARGATDPEAP